MLDPSYVTRITTLFMQDVLLETGKEGGYFNPVAAPRLIPHWSRQTLDVSVPPYSVQDGLVPFFIEQDKGNANAEGPFVLNPDPDFRSSSSTPNDSFFGLVGMWWTIANYNDIAATAADEVNSITEVLDSMYFTASKAQTRVVGPITMGEYMRSVVNARVSTAVLAGEMVGDVKSDFRVWTYPRALVVKPNTTLKWQGNVEGDKFQAITPQVIENPEVKWSMLLLQVSGAFDLPEPLALPEIPF